MVIAATGPARPGRAAPGAFATPAGHPGRMRSSLTSLGPPVSRDRIITSFPKWYTPDACLQLKEHFHGQVSTTCQRRNTGTVGLRLSKVVVVGDLYVGKTSLIHRFCKNVFDRDYKATIGVDFEIERFEIAGIPYSLQIWDTAGQEKFKCIASAYYRGAQVIITAFDLTDVQTLEHTRQWLEDALRENEPGSCFVFLVGTKKDLLSGAACKQAEVEAVRLANEMQAEYWSVSAKTGENVKAFFSRVAALAFEQSVLQDLERRSSARAQVGDGDLIRKGLENKKLCVPASQDLCGGLLDSLEDIGGPPESGKLLIDTPPSCTSRTGRHNPGMPSLVPTLSLPSGCSSMGALTTRTCPWLGAHSSPPIPSHKQVGTSGHILPASHKWRAFCQQLFWSVPRTVQYPITVLGTLWVPAAYSLAGSNC
ncbi:ras-related protein Rab-36 isoform X1 [Vulpes lagopus]|uniref:ras-related protein Rab-36 isoform X1 n=1 Tax=Vulpes lagopus TaxID=494514 RepID=UPI001BC9E1EE|nr:ras-related protein Rab-36 isoform X1 [Vulpes lagopus]